MLAARHPTSHHGNLTNQQGHDLDVRLKGLALVSAHLLAARRPVSTLIGRGGRPPLALIDGLLHVNGSQHPLTTLDEACALAGVDPSADLPPALNVVGDAATEVAVDRQAFDALIGWYALCQSALESLADVMSTDENPTAIQLWPEHFDVALEAGSQSTRATYGGSPGDTYFSEPYLYVGPFRARNGEFWNAEFGAAMTRGELHPGVDPLSFYLEARRFLAEH